MAPKILFHRSGAIRTIYVYLLQQAGCSVTAEEQMNRATDRKGGKGIEPSMLVDVLNARHMEVEVILGKPVEVAKGLRVEVPRMETLYALIKALDEAMALRQPGKSLAGDETESAS